MPDPNDPASLFQGFVYDSGGRMVGGFQDAVLYDIRAASLDGNSLPPVVQWLPTGDSCDISRVRLIHLDGSSVTSAEYDKMQRFLRLWKKMGWTMDETDKATMGLGAPPVVPPGQHAPVAAKDCFNEFTDDCSKGTTSDCGCGTTEECGCTSNYADGLLSCDITPAYLHQLVYVNKLLDSTGLDLITLLTFWTDISTVGDDSQYKRLFLTYNLLAVDTVFQADKYGNYLTTAAKITDHIPVIMAAFNLKAADIANIMQYENIADSLTLANISLIYRYSLLMRLLNIKSSTLQDVKTIFGDPFADAQHTEKFMENWGKMEDYGFTFAQLNYILNNVDDPNRPIKPTFISFLKLAKTFYDGLNAIIAANPDVNTPDDAVPTATVPVVATAELATASIALLFTPAVTAQVMALLQGTTVYSTNAPVNLVATAADFTALLTGTLIQKIKYDYVNGGVQVTGILTTAETAAAKALFSANTFWAAAIDRLNLQPTEFFNDVLYGIITDAADRAILLEGDYNVPASQQADPDNPAPDTAPAKLFCFMKVFMPFLRERLMHTFIVSTLATQTGLSQDVTDMLISNTLVSGTPAQPIVEVFKSITNAYQPAAGSWSGYLIPTSTDVYTFALTVQTNTLNAAISVNGQALNFTQQADPNNVYLSDPVKLQAGRAYKFWVTGLDINLTGLAWKTPTTPKSTIPASAMLVDDLTESVTTAYVQLQKAGIVASIFNLTDAEINYLQQNGADFSNLDFNAITFQSWLRLGAYTQLRRSLPPTNLSLIQFFAWAKQTTDTTNLGAQIAAVTNWLQSDVDKLLAAGHFNLLDNGQFVNEKKLLKLQQALYVAANIAIDINLLFDWAKPVSKFWVCHDIAESIRKSIKARYKETDWEQVVKPLNDQLREHQRDALISYLLVQPDLKDWGVIDANSLFEFFLIDVQMDSCMETSRIKQGTLSIQLFVQRCFLGLEEPYIGNDVLDAARWKWMQYNNVWVANRKVFLYPENWIVESLRDDKSDFYKALESQLLQKDINPQNVQDALNSYLFQVDDVANMLAVGIFVEEGTVKGATVPVKYHIFSRTRNAPYFFYYRYFDVIESNWYPWEQVQVDITSYDIEGPTTGQVFGNGAFLTPVVWNGRLLIFFPQMTKKVMPPSSTGASYNSNSASGQVPIIQWEIKMAWSEYRNGKWTQKQVSTDAIYDNGNYTATTLPKISFYSFVAYVDNANQNVQIIPCWSDGLVDPSNVFMFQGSTISVAAGTSHFNPSASPNDFNFMRFQSVESSGTYTTYPLQYNGTNEPYLAASEPYIYDNTSAVNIETPSDYAEFYQPFSHQLLGLLASDTSGDLTDFFSSNLTLPSNTDEAFGSYFDSSLQVTSYSELKTPYAIYNWELFFHTPATIAGKLSSAQQFQAAKQWYEYIFNPAAPGSTPQRAWQFYPFTQINADNYLEYLFNMLQSNTANDDINAWRSNPFEPHLIARGRPVAYMKWIVMQYMDNLIAWGDYLFTQHTLETINQATQLYILAYHIMGPRPQLIPKRGKILPETYNSLLNKWDAFGNAMVELELAFPFSNQINTPMGIGKGDIGFANIFGFATSLYFCLPSNPELTAYWDTLDDRLGKIRACENIEGVFGLPPLWDPPIDPALLVQAAAQGLSISSVLNDLDSPVPNYRFNYLVQKALELCNELKSLGGNLLSAFEKGDGETLASMRASQESTMQNLVMQVKQLQLNEANAALDGLHQNRETPAYRMQHYLDLIGQDASKIPGADADFTALAGPPQSLVTDSELILTSYEKQEMDKASDAKDLQEGVGIVETLAGVLHLLPLLAADVKPIGVGAGLCFGGDQLGSALGAVARGMQVAVGNLNAESAAARSKGGYLRQLQDRVLQANLAGFEIKQIDKQILSQQIRISITNQEITNQQKAIDNAAQTLDFLTNKYTNQQLYSWMKDTLKTLYYQVYTLAYGLAQKAEKVYRFERGLSSSNFIQFGYWDASHDGLLAGENLFVGLKQLEAAYQQNRGYDFEISKNISLRQIDPIALLTLRTTGTCQFELPEVLFDMDFPGHYMRRIKSVALSVPCIAGPYTGINATLRMTQNTFRQNTMPGSAYPQDTTKNDPRFMTVNVPITSVAVSHGQSDSGVFELNFKDERYMPFEGAGVISQWSLSLPDFKQIDYNTITDVIMTVRYTSIDGGDKQKKAATTYLNTFVKNVQNLSQNEGLFAIFDLKNDLPNEWYKATQLPPAADGREISLTNIVDRLPVYTKTSAPDKIIAQDVYVLTEAGIASGDILINQGTNAQNVVSHGFGSGVDFKPMHVFTAPGININMQNWTLAISNTAIPLNNMWMVVRYTLN
ncbi:PA14 domain protein [Mucilaginibacter gotjawali]|uniref:PA14 domain protein n=1 Tax=Mucilaginibacter gotjawali TaxID=1550579 RepID=A0A0X8X365_9SPHI|nr:neuraminidase-like domain-containing protein [Mucilaginibacter gotjawali]BAU54874.1 PA14 domain protein [Mucilaginibacter gotjawali]